MRNLTKKDKRGIFLYPLIVDILLCIYSFLNLIQISFDIGVLITTISLLLVTNIFALVAFNQKNLTQLYHNNKTKYGDSLYLILSTRYKTTIYTSLIFVTLLTFYHSLTIPLYHSLDKIIESIILYFFIIIILLNIYLIRYYFDVLEINLGAKND